MQMMWLKIDVGLPRGRATTFSTLGRQIKVAAIDICVKYPDAHVEYFPLPIETVCDGRPPSAPVHLVVFENFMWQ